MTIGTFPVPKDVRADRDFEFWLGQDELLRTPFLMADPDNESFDVGEWVKTATSGGVTKVQKLENTDDLTSPALGARCSWTLYRPGGSDQGGQTDAMATKQIDTITGTYQAKTKFYNTGGSFAPGYLLVAVYDGTLGGMLDAPVPGAMTARQLQGVVAKVVEVAGGRLWYEAPGL